MRRYFGIRWLTIALIMLGALVNFLSRQTLSVAAPTVIANLHITTEQYGWITAAFQGTIMLQPVVGYIMDILGVKTGFALFAFAWSAICMAHGLATNWQMLAALRGALGFADPDAEIGYGYVTNQMGTSLTGDPRDVALRTALYASLAG